MHSNSKLSIKCVKNILTANWTNALILCLSVSISLTLSSAHLMVWFRLHTSEKITIPLSFYSIRIILCFTLSCSESWDSPQGTWPWGGLLPQGAVAARVVLVATAKSTNKLPLLWRETASRNGWNRNHSGEGGQHVLHAETGVLVAKLVLYRKRGGRWLIKCWGAGMLDAITRISICQTKATNTSGELWQSFFLLFYGWLKFSLFSNWGNNCVLSSLWCVHSRGHLKADDLLVKYKEVIQIKWALNKYHTKILWIIKCICAWSPKNGQFKFFVPLFICNI